jgi:hypothetical protein
MHHARPSTFIFHFLLVAAAWSLTGCSSPHFFPHSRPLFAGLEEETLSPQARIQVAKAKEDFQKLRHHQPPAHATSEGRAVTALGEVSSYRGDGYRILVTDKSSAGRGGPSIVIDPKVTGGAAYEYDEVTWPHD